MDIAIYGAGGFGKEVACLINAINTNTTGEKWNIIGFFDDAVPAGTVISNYGKVLGNFEVMNTWRKHLAVVLAIGTPSVLKNIVENTNNTFISFPNLIHPSVDISDIKTFKIGRGNIVQRFCTGSCDVNIGDFNLFNSSTQLGHDVTVGNYNVFMPGVRISGEVKMGDCNFFGVGSIVLQQIKIGDKIKLGAGSVLMTKPKNENLYIGNPAKKILI